MTNTALHLKQYSQTPFFQFCWLILYICMHV